MLPGFVQWMEADLQAHVPTDMSQPKIVLISPVLHPKSRFEGGGEEKKTVFGLIGFNLMKGNS